MSKKSERKGLKGVAEVREGLMSHGVSSEYRAALALTRAGFWTNMSPTFFDRDGEKTREYDLAATLPEFPVEGGFEAPGARGVVIALACEVKYSVADDPWVLIRPTGTGFPIPRAPTCWPTSEIESLSEFLKGREHPLEGSGNDFDAMWTGVGVVQPSPLRTDRLNRAASFTAIQTACKAAEDLLSFHVGRCVPPSGVRFAGARTPAPAAGTPSLIFVKPVVIVAGPLFSCTADDAGELVVAAALAGQVAVSYRSKSYKGLGQVVDVVHLDYLKEYGASIKRLRNRIAAELIAGESTGK